MMGILGLCGGVDWDFILCLLYLGSYEVNQDDHEGFPAALGVPCSQRFGEEKKKEQELESEEEKVGGSCK